MKNDKRRFMACLESQQDMLKDHIGFRGPIRSGVEAELMLDDKGIEAVEALDEAVEMTRQFASGTLAKRSNINRVDRGFGPDLTHCRSEIFRIVRDPAGLVLGRQDA